MLDSTSAKAVAAVAAVARDAAGSFLGASSAVMQEITDSDTME